MPYKTLHVKVHESAVSPVDLSPLFNVAYYLRKGYKLKLSENKCPLKYLVQRKTI
jgi:hypothetical protein